MQRENDKNQDYEVQKEKKKEGDIAQFTKCWLKTTLDYKL